MGTRIRSPFVGSIVVILLWGTLGTAAVAQSPSPDPSPVASASPVPAASVTPPPTVSLTFDEPNDAWWTGRDDGERTSNQDGGIRTVLRKEDYSTWQWIDLPAATDVLRVQALVFVEQGPGGGGPICGAAGREDRFFWGGVNEAGDWLLGRIIGSRLQVEARGDSPLPYEDRPIGGTQTLIVTLECAVDPAGGGDRVALWVDGYPAGEIVDRRFGPYDKAGLVVAGDEPGVTVFYDDLVAWDAATLATLPPVAGSPAPSSSPAASPEA